MCLKNNIWSRICQNDTYFLVFFAKCVRSPIKILINQIILRAAGWVLVENDREHEVRDGRRPLRTIQFRVRKKPGSTGAPEPFHHPPLRPRSPKSPSGWQWICAQNVLIADLGKMLLALYMDNCWARSLILPGFQMPPIANQTCNSVSRLHEM
jgi:hypothetical protein